VIDDHDGPVGEASIEEIGLLMAGGKES